MAELVLKNTKIYFKGYDLSGQMNNVSLTMNSEMLDKTTFGSSFRKRKHGMKSLELTGSGFWDASSNNNMPDDVIHPEVGSTNEEVMTVNPEGIPNSLAVITQGIVASYSPGGSIGELMGFDFAAQSFGAAAKGKMVRTSTIAGSGQSTIISLSRSSNTRRLYAAMHVINDTSDAADYEAVSIQTSPTSDFSANVSTHLKFGTTINNDDAGTAQWASTKGSSDTYYRLRWAGGSSALVKVAIGIH
jgi:hypothetical protein